MDIDVIIPVYKPQKNFFHLLEMLQRQSMPVRKVILMNTGKKYFEKLVFENREKIEKYRSFMEVHHLSKKEFDHGGTRNLGIKRSDADLFVCMTQDALPCDGFLIENLIRPLLKKEDRIAASFARQIARENSGILERFARGYNYPPGSYVRGRKDLGKYGIKTYFFSNVCAAYRRDVFEELGGFVKQAILNEDMLYSARAMKAGYRIAYVAEAKVFHSHDYSCRQQFQRNFDIGASQAMHPEVFASVRAENEGKKMVREAVRYLDQNGQRRMLPAFFLQCASRYAGFLLGKHYRKLPRWMVLRCTANREYWIR